MDLLAAQRKLAKVSQLEPGLMLGKILQAAVVARATQVRFAVSARDIQAKINFPEAARTDQEVQEHMATAFALAQGLRPRELSWQCGGLTRQFTGRVSGEGALKTEGLAVFRFEGRYPSLFEEIASWVVARRDAACLLRERAFLCPIPVFLDAVRVNAPESARLQPGCEVVQLALKGGLPRNRVIAPCPRLAQAQAVWLDNRVVRGYLSFGERPDPRFPPKSFIFEGAEGVQMAERQLGPHAVVDSRATLAANHGPGTLALTNHSSGHGQVPVTVSSQWEWLNADAYLSLETTRESYLQTLCARRWISLFPDQKQQSELWPVQDGLLLNKIPLTRCAGGCRVVVPVREVNLDLDQLNVLQDEVFQALQDKLVTELPRLRALWDSMAEPRRATSV